MKDLSGYKGKALRFLEGGKAQVGDVVEVKTTWGGVTGTVVPRYSAEDDRHVVLKLHTGYNVGLNVSKLSALHVKEKGEKPAFRAPPVKMSKGDLPRVAILGTGGTIASRIDYRTGAVTPAVTSEDLHGLIPELSEIARIEPEILFNVLSENLRPNHWTSLAKRIEALVNDGVRGVVITHGTDTLGYTSAALSFALKGIPIPVVLTAAQRSSDRPSSDATLNLIGAVSVSATAEFSGVYVALHLNESDEKVAVHRGTRVRKNHTSRRDAFQSIGVPLAAVWGGGGFELEDSGLPRRNGKKFAAKPKFEEKVALIKFYPSMPASLVRSAVESGARGLVIEGTGLGHTNSESIKELRRFTRQGGVAVMTSQCINGRVDMNVYETGRDLLKAGVVPVQDMLAETALAKLMWVLGNTHLPDEAIRMMTEDLAGEITQRGFPG